MSPDTHTESAWRQVLDELGITPQSTAAPDGAHGMWFQTLARFARTGFLRVLASPNDAEDSLALRAQIAPGPSTAQTDAVLDALVAGLAQRSNTVWQAQSKQVPWELSTTLALDTQDGVETYRKALLALMKLGDLVAGADEGLSVASLKEALGVAMPANEASPAQPETALPQAGGTSTEGFVFETIGSGASSATAPAFAETGNIERANVSVVGDHLEAAVSVDTVLRPVELTRLADGLAHHLRVRFDADVTPLGDSERAERALSEPHQSNFYLRIQSADETLRNPAGRADLQHKIEAYFQKIQDFGRLGIDIFDVLGLRQDAAPASASASSTILSASPAPLPGQGATTNNDGIVLDLGAGGFAAASGAAGDGLRKGDFADQRLRRPDATTPLVDVVLRHPGYSDRRIGQVLSILLSIEYHAALRLAENAPCVIAWGLANERARSFKDVIETTGGKAVLVEPDTFAER
ncbi:MAG: hypothetical protein H0U74_23610 [Bradymonadaceae bacterium]|nr:hypothetical protein [Lujinxingiaceae bacterium]